MTADPHARRAADALAGLAPRPRTAAPIGRAEREARLARARACMAEHGCDALLVVAGDSLRYFTGIPWSPTERMVALVLPRSAPPFVIAPEFERGSLQAVLQIEAEYLPWEEHEHPAERVAEALRARGARTLALDPQAPYAMALQLQRFGASLRIVDGAPIIDDGRMRKSSTELALIQEAMSITLEVHRLAASILAPGIAASQVVRFIDDAHRRLAGSGSTFCAVQFGEATAYPHGLPGDQRLAEDDLVLIDTGCRIDGYHSDITRTYAVGRPDPAQAEVWAVERAAQQAAFDAVHPGVPCEEIDNVARRVLEQAGFGPDYKLPGLPHRTGHGLGLSIHEPAYLVRGDRTPLAPGMCFSNEPMIVVPGRFGVRLEDHFFVTEHGAQWFTPPSVALDRPFAD